MAAPDAAADPFTLAVIQSSIAAIGEEMFAALRQTAMSAIIYEVLDMGTGITDPDGRLAASGCGIPTFVAVIDKAVARVIALHGTAAIRPGDLFVTNDPHFGGVTHLNDIVLLLPVFADGHLVAWTGNIAHWPDIGGMVAGSMGADATDIWQEGLRLPAVRLFEAGRAVAPVFAIMRANTRLPEALEGDLWAGIAALRLGERRIVDLVRRYGRAAFAAAMADAFDHSEQTSRAGLRHLPPGRHSLRDTGPDGQVWTVHVEIAPDRFTVDLADCPDAAATPYNLSRDGAVIAAQMIFKALTDPGQTANAGSFRPLTVITRPGSIFDPPPHAPQGLYFESRIRLIDLIWHCLAEAMPHLLPAGHFASICSTVLSGLNPDTGRRFTVVEPQVGGWGATEAADGISANFAAGHGETFNCPAEIAEARYGVLVGQRRLNDAPGGAGRFRGGRGAVTEWRIRAPEAFLSVAYGAAPRHPWGLAGGEAGSPNYVEVDRSDGGRERFTVATHLALRQGDVVRLVTGTGGGHGDPARRTLA